MKRFIGFNKDTFNTKTYIWKNKNFQNIATFKFDGVQYNIHFDEIMPNVYNFYFYYLNGEEKIFSLTNNHKNNFKILSNVKNSVDDFLINHNNLEFLGFSSYEYEREDMYTLFLQNIKLDKFDYSIITKPNKTYYFLFVKNLTPMIKDVYVDKFILRDNENKK